MKILGYILAGLILIIGSIPKTVMYILYGTCAGAWVISMIIYIIQHLGVEHEVFVVIQIIFGVTTPVFAIWKFSKSNTWNDHIDALDRLNGE